MREQIFLIDQRKMVKGTVDIDTTNQLRKTMKKKLLRQESRCNPQKEISKNLNISISSSSSEYDIVMTHSNYNCKPLKCFQKISRLLI